MSRRRTRRNPNHYSQRTVVSPEHESHFPEAYTDPGPSWTDPIGDDYPGYEWWQWQEAFAEITASVAWNVWRKQGARLYATQRDTLLRDDLQDWLWVRAQEIANRFTPDPYHPNPHKQWAAYLTKALNEDSRYHFGEVVGDDRYGPGRAAVQAYRSGIASTDALDETDAERGRRATERHPLHGHDPLAGDPLAVLIRIEEFSRTLSELAAQQQADGVYITSTDSTCLTNLCTRPAVARGYCRSHYNALRKNAIDTGTWERLTPEECIEPGCEDPSRSRGYCQYHYQQWRLANAPECSEDSCDKPAHSRGLCHAHYRRQRAA